MTSDNFTLLLTACIEVQNKALVKRNDTESRLRDYQMSLRKWLTKQDSIKNIVFVDNSGYSLDSLKEIAKKENPYNKNVEFLSFLYKPEQDADISLGELLIIDYGLKHSTLLSLADRFVKVTGRIFIRNIDNIVDGLEEDFHAVSSFSENLCYVDSVIVAFDKKLYIEKVSDYAIQNVRNANSKKMDFERVYALAIHKAILDDFRWYPFPFEPIIDGMSGTKNVRYRNRTFRAICMTLVSRLYHYYYRNSYGKRSVRKHLLERWDIHPRWE